MKGNYLDSVFILFKNKNVDNPAIAEPTVASIKLPIRYCKA